MLHRKTLRCSSTLTLLVTLAAASWSCPARAQTSNAALAESLFREGKRLSSERKFAEACPKFAESYKLDPGLGTLLNLAICHESEGKPATAWAEFSEASSRAKRDGDTDRAALADEHVRALEPKLAHISITLAPGAAVPGLVIKFDSRELASAALGLPIAVDPGKHVVEASAPGKETSTQNVETPLTPSNLTVTVPVLKDSASAPVAVTPVPPPSANAPSETSAPAANKSSGTNTGAIVSGVATGAFLTGAVVTGVLYASKRSDFNDANDSGDPSRFDKRDSAQTMGIVNAVMVGGAAVSAGVLVYFLVSGSKHESPPSAARLRIAPVVSPQLAGFVLGGQL